jgi:DNA-directed RNA polymerase subunit RPC12/RpoP
MDKEYTCEECDAEFNVEYDFIATPEFCPFCGNKLSYDDGLVDEDWEDDGTDRGC